MNDDELHDLLVRVTDPIESPGLAQRSVLLARQRRRRQVGVLTTAGAATTTAAVLIAVALAGVRGPGPVDPLGAGSEEERAILDSEAWLSTHDHRVVAQLRGPRIVNVTAVHRGAVVKGDVQTTEPAEMRQVDYYRFRVIAGRVETIGAGETEWRSPTPSQRAFIADISDPRWILGPLATPGLRDHGAVGDAEMYRDSEGDSLFMIDGRPARVVTHDKNGAWVRTFGIDPHPRK